MGAGLPVATTARAVDGLQGADDRGGAGVVGGDVERRIGNELGVGAGRGEVVQVGVVAERGLAAGVPGAGGGVVEEGERGGVFQVAPMARAARTSAAGVLGVQFQAPEEAGSVGAV